MFRALLCPSSGAYDYSAVYHISGIITPIGVMIPEAV